MTVISSVLEMTLERTYMPKKPLSQFRTAYATVVAS